MTKKYKEDQHISKITANKRNQEVSSIIRIKFNIKVLNSKLRYIDFLFFNFWFFLCISWIFNENSEISLKYFL
jgi:hypothetical protein